MKLRFIYILIIFTFLSCTDEIPLEADFEPKIFIFGLITNENKPITISVQESVPVNNTTPVFINNASISLYSKEKEGIPTLITNEFYVENGNYTSKKNINTIIGNYYWIEVELSNGTIFKSVEEELLKTVVPINSIIVENSMTRISFSDPGDDTNFYRLITLFYQNEQIEEVSVELSNDVLFNGNPNAFIETISLQNDRIEAVLANLNYDTYQYYLNLQKQEMDIEGFDDQETNGDPSQLFASPPVNLEGNILNTKTKRKSLGNFSVISIDHYSN